MLLIRCGWLRLCSDPICSEQHLGLGYCSSSRGTRGILRRAEAPEADSVSSSSLIRPRLRHRIYTKALPPHSWLSGAWAMGSLQLWRISLTVPPVAGASSFLRACRRGGGSTQPLEEEGQLEKVWSGCHREANPSV